MNNILPRSILHIQTDTGLSGGIANYIQHIVNVKRISEIKYFVSVDPDFLELAESSKFYHSSEVLGLKTDIKRINLFSILYKIRSVIISNNITLLNSHALKSGLLAMICKILFGFNYVHTNHGLRFSQKSKLLLPIFFLIEIIVLLFSEKYIFIRQSDFNYLCGLVPFLKYSDKLKIIKFKINPPFPLSSYSKKSNIKEYPLIIGIGSMIPVKNIDRFLYWLKCLKNTGIPFESSWLGDGPLRDQFEQKAINLGLNVRWQGHVSKDYIYSQLSSASLLFLTSKFEVYPTIVLESFSVGTPVVSSQFFGIEELIVNNVNGLIIPNRASNEYISKSLSNLIIDTDLYRNISNNCLNSFINNHSPLDYFQQQYINLYKSI